MSAAMSEHGDQLKQEMGEVVDTAKDQVIELRDTARTRITEEADRRRTELGTGARRIAEATRDTSQQLRDEGKDMPAMLIDRASTGLDRAASYLENTEADRMWQDVRDVGRRMPWLFVAAGVAAGFAASRMIKAAGQDQWSGQRPAPISDQMSLGTGEDLEPMTRPATALGTDVTRLPDAPSAEETAWAAGSTGATGS